MQLKVSGNSFHKTLCLINFLFIVTYLNLDTVFIKFCVKCNVFFMMTLIRQFTENLLVCWMVVELALKKHGDLKYQGKEWPSHS